MTCEHVLGSVIIALSTSQGFLITDKPIDVCVCVCLQIPLQGTEVSLINVVLKTPGFTIPSAEITLPVTQMRTMHRQAGKQVALQWRMLVSVISPTVLLSVVGNMAECLQ